ncbi:MAG: YibE/F family protein [Acidimicrobiales bacterium]|nr:YibE/F family protein [Acidimicrobiales bacterium]
MGHSHGHGHEHGGFDAQHWRSWLADPRSRVIGWMLMVAAAATVGGIIAYWPSGDGRQAAIVSANELGLVSDRLAATVLQVTDAQCSYSSDPGEICRQMDVRLDDGPEAGSLVALPEVNLAFNPYLPDLSPGDGVVLGYEDSTGIYFFTDVDRRSTLLILAALFMAVVVTFGRLRGLLALVAMAATLVILVAFVAPSVLDGNDPLAVSVVAACAIAFVTLYTTHGPTPTTTVALAGTLGALGVTLALSWLFFALAEFSGLASEEALTLPFVANQVDVGALLLGGAIIGALGALDDVTVTQVATVSELRRHSPDMPSKELFAAGIRVGREHIASTVNTLLLAYAGASMPLLLLFAASDQSLQMIANTEVVAIEIARTLCGSMGLVAAVPVTTALAAALSGRADAITGSDAAQRETPPPSWDDFAPPDELRGI